MGWYAVYAALKSGQGPYGNVRQTLRGETDRGGALAIALGKIAVEISGGEFTPDRRQRARLAYWRRKATPTLF